MKIRIKCFISYKWKLIQIVIRIEANKNFNFDEIHIKYLTSYKWKLIQIVLQIEAKYFCNKQRMFLYVGVYFQMPCMSKVVYMCSSLLQLARGSRSEAEKRICNWYVKLIKLKITPKIVLDEQSWHFEQK